MITNIIEVELLAADRVQTRPVHQWDVGQIIKVTDTIIEDGTVVEFGNSTMKQGLQAYMLNGEVKIPAPALQQERDLTAYVVITNQNIRTTVKEIFVPVIPKPKPEDYVNVTLGGITVTDDGDGNVTMANIAVTDDGNGNVIIGG